VNPSEVRRRILDDHQRIRALLDRQDALSQRAPTDAEAFAQLRATAMTLLNFLLHHIDLEDEILAPALAQADAWGAQRVSGLRESHAHQRLAFRRLVDALRDEPLPSALVEAARKLSEEVRAEMSAEERWLVHVDVLRDDVVTIGGFTG
jgi:hypothetical protein